MFENLEQAERFVRENEVQMIDLKYADLVGRWHHLTLLPGQFTKKLLEEGVGFDGSSVGFKDVKSGDMALMPDLSTGALDPFWEAKTLSFICSTVEADTRQVFARDSRNIARRAEEHLRETGIADESRWGPEFEFYIFDHVAFENEINRVGYHLESAEAGWNGAQDGSGYRLPRGGGYHILPPQDSLYNLRAEIALHLEAMGAEVRYHHHEVGCSGQCEIETPMLDLVRAGDVTMMVKYVARMTAHRHGKTVTFMPKPLHGEAGNGMHFHQQLFKDGQNLFYAPQGYAGLSQTALCYIGGLLKHAPALLALTNPSTNSYRRLVPGYEAPVCLFFSLANRSAAIRVPKYATTHEAKRFEFRPPDATCNVYLALAAQLLAGLDGIQREIAPAAEGFGPIDGNIFAWPEERRRQIKALPSSLKTALEALAADHDFLLAGGVFSEDFIADWIERKMAEHDEVHHRPHPYEMYLYYDL